MKTILECRFMRILLYGTRYDYDSEKLLDAYAVEDEVYILEVVLQSEASVKLLAGENIHNCGSLG